MGALAPGTPFRELSAFLDVLRCTMWGVQVSLQEWERSSAGWLTCCAGSLARMNSPHLCERPHRLCSACTDYSVCVPDKCAWLAVAARCTAVQ